MPFTRRIVAGLCLFIAFAVCATFLLLAPPDGAPAEKVVLDRDPPFDIPRDRVPREDIAVDPATDEAKGDPDHDGSDASGDGFDMSGQADLPVIAHDVAPPEEGAASSSMPIELRPGLTQILEDVPDAVNFVVHPWRSGEYFVVGHEGVVHHRVLGAAASTPALDLRASVWQEGEAGLHSIAFHPRELDRAFVFHNVADGGLVLAEYALDPQGRTFDATSRTVRLSIPPAHGSHNGGALAFGPDGHLYISVGDGGMQDDPQDRAQDLASFYGKILRIDVTGRGPTHAIPSDNPFVDGPRPEIWAYGFRNPWRMAFDHRTGDLWVGDVGGSVAEEIDVLPAHSAAGANYGWRIFEGNVRRHDVEIGETVAPVHEYRPTNGRCALAGGFVYRGPIASLDGAYLYSDFCDGMLRALEQDAEGVWTSREIVSTGGSVVALAEDRDGGVLILHYGGALLRFIPE